MKTALVTGGTNGIGYGVCEVLLAQGWQVIATGVSEKEVADCPGADGLKAQRLDVTDDLSVSNCLAGVDRLDGLVNCAGVLMRGREYDLDVFKTVLEVNLTGTMRMCLAAQPLLQATSGAIVNTASMLSYFGGALVPAYAASKGGVAQLTKSLAAGWAENGIRVNAVAPGWIDTDMTKALQADVARNDAILSRTPLNRWGDPREIGELVAWLLSDKAGFVTGSVYPVDGGYSAV